MANNIDGGGAGDGQSDQKDLIDNDVTNDKNGVDQEVGHGYHKDLNHDATDDIHRWR